MRTPQRQMKLLSPRGRIANLPGLVASLIMIVLVILLTPGIVQESFAQEKDSALGALELKFKIAVEKTELAVADLAEKYRRALTGHLEEVQKSGELDKVLLVKGEIERFEKERSPAVKRSPLKSLSRLQEIYTEQHDRALEESQKRLSTLKVAYKKQLEALVRKLTVDGKLEQAIEVRAEIEKIGVVTSPV